jgi:solute carrier family 13 (sodium-dependent dicarboxylate transporter), member 2/3/5
VTPAPTSRIAFAAQRIGLVLGPVVAVTLYLALGNLEPAARSAAAMAGLMAVWWLTEALPLPATALVPLVALPALGVMPIAEAAAPYADPLIFLFLAGFLLALGMQRWGLHRRIALVVILLVGTSPLRLIAGFMVATALLSMFVSNTATAVMLMPIGTSVIGLMEARALEQAGRGGGGEPRDETERKVDGFAICLLLGIAYSASIGGIGTIIGTPPNTVLVGFLRRRYELNIGFAQWMLIGVPLVLVFLPLTWLLLTRVLHPVRLGPVEGGRELILSELRALGPMKPGEIIVMTVFGLTAATWIFRPLLGIELHDASIGMAGGIALFLIPVDRRLSTFAMDWEWAGKAPFGILLLFGGGLSLAGAMSATGLDVAIGSIFAALRGLPLPVMILLVALVVIFLTELTSNTAVTAALMPVLAGAADTLGLAPMMLLAPAALAASCAFMLPVATPPNAIIFSHPRIHIGHMVKAGIVLNLVGAVIITLLTWLWMPVVLGKWDKATEEPHPALNPVQLDAP